MKTPPHMCVISHTCADGSVGTCQCGTVWMVAPASLARIAFISPELRRRQKFYRNLLQLGLYATLPEAVKGTGARERERQAQELAQARVRARSWYHPYNRHIRAMARLRSIVLAQGSCAYCGDHPTQVDHIVPRSQGGTDRLRNLAPACRRCNGQKGHRTPGQWRAWRESRGLRWPPVWQAGEQDVA